MKKMALFLSMFAIARSLCALNVIHKESKTSTALVRLIDVSAQCYELSPCSKYHYYRLIIENASENHALVYNAQGSIQDSIKNFKDLVNTRKFQYFLGDLPVAFFAAQSFFGVINYASGFYKSRSAYECENCLGNVIISSAAAALFFSCLALTARWRSQLEKLDGQIYDSVKVGKALSNGMHVFQNAEGSIIIVSDHELQTVEIDIQQRNEAYSEITLTETTK